MYINLVRPPLILYSIYTCAKKVNTTNHRMKSLDKHRPRICLANPNKKVSAAPPRPVSKRVKGRILARNASTHHSSRSRVKQKNALTF